MTDWWRTQPERPEGESLLAIDRRTYEPEPVASSRPAVPPQHEEPEPRSPGSRRKAVRVVGAIAGVVVTGALVLNGVSGGDGSKEVPASASKEQGEDLPAAGGGPEEGAPAEGDSAKTPQGRTSPVPQETVTLTATPSGKGRVGVIMKVSIHNDTDEPLTVLATLVLGDSNPAIVGEGTLAPGSRTIQPGETAEGTVEFSVAKPPSQVALLDPSGNAVAVSD